MIYLNRDTFVKQKEEIEETEKSSTDIIRSGIATRGI